MEISQRCYECYDPKKAQECEKEVRICSAWIDEVMVSNDSAPTSRFVARNLETEIPNGQTFDTLSCIGFDYLYRHRKEREDGCDLTNNLKVLSTGLLKVFRENLLDSNGNQVPVHNASVDHEIQVGSHGKGKDPIAVSLELEGSKDRYRRAVQKAMKIATSVKDSANFFRRNAVVEDDGDGKVIVYLFFKKKFLNELW